MHKLYCLVGMCGSGKSVVADELKKKGFGFVRFGQLTIDIIKERGLEINEENEKSVREQLRKEHGMGGFATLNIPRFEELLKKSDVVGDGLYSWSEYKILKEHFGERLVVIAVYAPPELRYRRLEARKMRKEDKDIRNRPISKDKAQSRDYAEIENIEKGGPIAMADHTIDNTGTVQHALAQLDRILKQEQA